MLLWRKRASGEPFIFSQPVSISISDFLFCMALKRCRELSILVRVIYFLDLLKYGFVLVGWFLAPLKCPAGHFLFQKLERFAKSDEACYLTCWFVLQSTHSLDALFTILLENTQDFSIFSNKCFVGTSDSRLSLWSFYNMRWFI